MKKEKDTERMLGRISYEGKSLARRQIINENLEGNGISKRGKYLLKLFDDICRERGW